MISTVSVGYFCQHHWLQYIVLVFSGYCDIDSYFLGYAKNCWIFFGLKIKVGSEPM